MSNKKEEIRTNKKLEKKIPEVKERKSTSDSTTKSIGSLRETKLKPILISTIPGVKSYLNLDKQINLGCHNGIC